MEHRDCGLISGVKIMCLQVAKALEHPWIVRAKFSFTNSTHHIHPSNTQPLRFLGSFVTKAKNIGPGTLMGRQLRSIKSRPDFTLSLSACVRLLMWLDSRCQWAGLGDWKSLNAGLGPGVVFFCLFVILFVIFIYFIYLFLQFPCSSATTWKFFYCAWDWSAQRHLHDVHIRVYAAASDIDLSAMFYNKGRHGGQPQTRNCIHCFHKKLQTPARVRFIASWPFWRWRLKWMNRKWDWRAPDLSALSVTSGWLAAPVVDSSSRVSFFN